jgi:hypothetical protein
MTAAIAVRWQGRERPWLTLVSAIKYHGSMI